jgi:hypothetical protein
MTLRRQTWCLLGLLVFAASFAVRITAIKMFPQYDHHDDIEIYRASGALIVRGINPYDFSDHIPVRTSLREQSPNPYMRELSQARWDYYASSNLPMNLLFFGALNAISDTPLAHRYAYGFFDSLLSVLVVWFVLRHWPATPGFLGTALSSAGLSPNAGMFAERPGIGLTLGCFSPILFKNGAAIPEDKGIQILLMLAAVACYLSPRERIWFWGGAVFLGLSIAFKGLGIFLVPLFASRLASEPERAWKRSLAFAAVCAVVLGIWLIPFGRGVAAMVGTRLALASTLQPQHASIWVIPSIYLPSGWKALRLVLLLSALGVSFVGYWRKRIGIDVLCATVLLAFVVIWMINGGTDRQNIALLPAILLLGRRSPRAAFICLMPYLLAGLGGFVTHGLHGQPVNFAVRETLEGLGILLFVIVYLVIAGWTWLFSRNLNPAPAAEFKSSTV